MSLVLEEDGALLLFAKGTKLRPEQIVFRQVFSHNGQYGEEPRPKFSRSSLQGTQKRGNKITHGKETEDTERLRKHIAEYLKKDPPRGMFTEAEPGQVHDTTAAYGRRLAEIFGKRIVYFNNSRPDIYAFDGATLPSTPNVIYIDANSSKPHMVVVGHELVHVLRRDHPDIYTRFVEATSNLVQNYEEYRSCLDSLTAKEGKRLSDSRAYEEFLGDFVGDQGLDPVFWQEIANRQPTIFKKLVSFVKKFLNKILNKLLYKDSTSQYFKDIKKARDTAVDALAEYAKWKIFSPSSSPVARQKP